MAGCNAYDQLKYYRARWKARRIIVEERSEQAQIQLAILRGECRNAPGPVIHTVERLGVPLLYVRRQGGEPGGSYIDSCRDCAWTTSSLECQCRTGTGSWAFTRLQQACASISNRDGHLHCD